MRNARKCVSMSRSGAIWHCPLLPWCYVEFLRIGNASNYNPMFEQMNLQVAVLKTGSAALQICAFAGRNITGGCWEKLCLSRKCARIDGTLGYTTVLCCDGRAGAM